MATAWASLRFADSQRIEWSSFSFNVATFRGVCYQTKTSWRGQPFGFICSGFLSHGSHSWVAKWLRVLDSLGSQNFRDYACHASFLWLELDSDANPILPLQAMTYSTALKWLRYFLTFPWLSEPPVLPLTNYTLHSLKGTLLSFALEIPEISDGHRSSQGHHRGSSVVLYSRDDVLGALRLQQQLRLAVLGNWRPRTPQHRGGQSPMPVIPVVVEAFSKSLSTSAWGYFSFDVTLPGALPHCVAPTLPGLQPTDTASGPAPQHCSNAADDSALEDSAESEFGDMGPPDELIFLTSTGIVHAASATASSSRTLCGATLAPDKCSIVDNFRPEHRLCRRAACVAAFASLSKS